MSMECNDWTDWGQSDWDNGWTNNVSQNFNSQTAPKEQATGNRGGKFNQSASRYFEKDPVDDEWIIQNQTQVVQGQNVSYTLEAFNNNNSFHQTENREIAPPDNRQSFQTSQNHNVQDAHKPKKQLVSASQVSSKPFTTQQQVFQDNVDSSNISSYFTSKQGNQIQSSNNQQLQAQFFSDVSNQNTVLGAASISANLPVHQQLLEQETHYSSLGYQVHSFKQAHPNSVCSQQMELQRPLSGVSSRQPISQQNQQTSAFSNSQPLTGVQQHAVNYLTPLHDSHIPEQSTVNLQQTQIKEDRNVIHTQGDRYSPSNTRNTSQQEENNASHQYGVNKFQGSFHPQQHIPQAVSGKTHSHQLTQSIPGLPPNQQQMSPNLPGMHSPQKQMSHSESGAVTYRISQNVSDTSPPPQHSSSNILSMDSTQQKTTNYISGLALPHQERSSSNSHKPPPKQQISNNLSQQETSSCISLMPPPQQQTSNNLSQQEKSSNISHIPSPQQQTSNHLSNSHPSQQQASNNISSKPLHQQLVYNCSGLPPPQQESSNNISCMSSSHQQPLNSVSSMPLPPKETSTSVSSESASTSVVMSSKSYTLSNEYKEIQSTNNPNSFNKALVQSTSANSYPSNGNSPSPANNNQLSTMISQTYSRPDSNGSKIYLQEAEEKVHPIPSYSQTSLEHSNSLAFKQMSSEEHQHTIGAPSIQSSTGVNQAIYHQMGQILNQQQQAPDEPNKCSGGSTREEITTSWHGENQSTHCMQSPQQGQNPLTYKYPPPPLMPNITHSSTLEVQDQSIFHASSLNLFPPMATSSPLAGNKHVPENEERLPENKEHPDNAEEITHDLKLLSVNPACEAENDAQKHCAIDRNQYLETGQFSAQKENNAFIQNADVNDEGEAPPPGLHRLVTGQGYEPSKSELETTSHSAPVGEGIQGQGVTRDSSPLSSIEDDSEGRDDNRKETRREVPGEAEPLQGRVVLGQVPTPPDTVKNRTDDRTERDKLERMVVGELGGQSVGNTSDDYRQMNRASRHPRHRRNDSSFENEERDYSSDRDRRNDDHRRRDERPRRRREQRSPDYRSDEDYDDRRPYRGARDSRRIRDYSPDRSYYRDYYREEDQRHPRHYYHRDYDDYYRDNQRSRPSSRSGSDYRHPLAKHSMRVLPGNHYYDHSGSGYPDLSIKYSSQREYFERMRQVDPAGYAAWYYQYMQGRFMQESARAFSSDRASVHSGQSSSNQRHGVSTPQEAVDDLTREEEMDYTTRLYDCAHIRGNLDGYFRLVIVEPNYPLDHQKATVSVCLLTQSSHDKDTEDFFQQPGPFIPGVTHRNTVLQYLKRLSEKATKSSEKLLYDLVHMTVKGFGEINGSDVADLLMESYKHSKEDNENNPEVRATSISRFRELLQQGNKAEALEWAMENGAWGHALFLASKMDERTHNDIMLRFANSVPHNDPLQTLYQLMSGYVPQASTCCADKKWSDWRPHLAMMLSNPSGNPSLDRQAIITLGDSLSTSGRLFASHFCYITAQVEFSNFGPDAKLVLLGSSHNQDFSKFATCRSIMLTMCYEYGLKLKQPKFNIPSLQVYKVILAARLIDAGKLKNALLYCELLAHEILSASSLVQKSLVSTVIDFASRLKMFEPVVALSGATDKDPSWLTNLKHFHEALPDDQELSIHKPTLLNATEPHDDIPQNSLSYTMPDSQPNTFSETGLPSTSLSLNSYQMCHQPTHSTSLPPVPTYQAMNQPIHSPVGGMFQPVSQANSHILTTHSKIDTSEDIYCHQGYSAPPSLVQVSNQQHPLVYPSVSDVSGTPDNIEINSGPESSWENRPPPPPVIQSTSSEPSQSQRNSFFKATEEQLKLNEVGATDKKQDTSNPSDSKIVPKHEEQSSGWFGGIFDKLALRPKNQMRLPDDNNPSIVWDEKKKKWVNLDGDTESSSNVKPPPKASEALPPQGNKYKIQKGKLMKSNYVDVMGSKDKADFVQPNFVPNSVQLSTNANYFTPPPVETNTNAPVDFITPAPYNSLLTDTTDNNNKGQLSRSSSVSSLSREVQYYMAPPSQRHAHSKRVPGNAPQMYNPSRYPT